MAAAAAAEPEPEPEWLVTRDGCLSCEEGLRSLAYHPSLNAILAVTSHSTVKVIDGTSGAVLQVSRLNGESVWAGPGRTAPGRRWSRNRGGICLRLQPATVEPLAVPA